MHVDCDCGFSGSIREQQGPAGIIARCFGCDQLYQYNDERVEKLPKPKELSFEEMKKLLDASRAGKDNDSPTGETKPKRKRTRKTKPAETEPAVAITEKPAVPIYKSLHFYLRPGDSWQELLAAANREVNYAGPAMLIFVHQHFHGEKCVDSCRQIETKEA